MSLAGFADSIHHARYGYKDEVPPYEVYKAEQIVGIAENLLLFQNPDGGWPKNIDWQRVWTPEEKGARIASLAEKDRKSTFDNGNVYTQLRYLAGVHAETGNPAYARAAEKALDWIFAAQNPSSGGFEGADVSAVTYNDEVMAGVLGCLLDIVRDWRPEAGAGKARRALYSFLSPARRAGAQAAFDRGIECVLGTQIRLDGRLTAWCQQHDHKTLEPIWARAFEPASITAGETVGIVRLLMRIENPSERVRNSIRAAVGWLESSALSGIRIVKVDAPPAVLGGRFSDYELVERADPAAPRIWARFYDLETGAPLFYDRDRSRVAGFNDLSRERRVGYGYYGTWPEKLLSAEYPAWLKAHP